MSDTDLMEADLTVLAHTIALAFGGERQTALEKEIGRLLVRAEENAAKRHARIMRKDDDSEWLHYSEDLMLAHPALRRFVLDVWQYLETYRLLQAKGQWLQIAGLRITRAK